MSAGSEFHTVGAATRKLRAPKLSLNFGNNVPIFITFSLLKPCTARIPLTFGTVHLKHKFVKHQLLQAVMT